MQIIESVGEGAKNGLGDVKIVQTLLTSKGFGAGRVDGVCGNKTVAAIRAFQATFLSAPDGVVEPTKATWRHLVRPGATMPAHAPLAKWAGESNKWTQEKKLERMHPDLRPKVTAVVEALTKRGFQPTIFFGWRSVAAQLQIVKQGHSTVKFSFHNAQAKDGTPNSHAADIIDVRWGWSNAAQLNGFWDALGEEAKAQGLYWGGDWKDFKDVAHVQLVPNSDLHRVKEESGL